LPDPFWQTPTGLKNIRKDGKKRFSNASTAINAGRQKGLLKR